MASSSDMPAIPPPTRAPSAAQLIALIRGLAGAIVGGAIGYLIFRWLLRYGLYGLMIPGACLGLGAGLAAGRQSHLLALLCACAALGLGLWAEWSVHPFIKDGSLVYFLRNVALLKPPTLLMIGLGAVFAYWFGQGR